jgi:hypothetical protein
MSVSLLVELNGETGRKKAFKRYPIGYFHIGIAEVRTEEGKLHLFVAIDRTSKFAFASIAESLLISWRWNSRCSDDRVRCGMVAWRA